MDIRTTELNTLRLDENDKICISSNVCSAIGTVVETQSVYIEKEKNVKIISYEILCPGKVMRVTFDDGKQEKMICHEKDTFDLEKGLYLAIAKHLHKNTLTPKGIEMKANELSIQKEYVSMVEKAIKNHNKIEALKAEVEREHEKEKQRQHEKKVKEQDKQRNKKIALIEEAVYRALVRFSKENI